MIRILQPWFENLGKRQVKAPKVYFRDSGLLHQFLGIADMSALREHPRYGASWEGFALEQVLSTHGEADAPATTKSMRTALDDLGLDHLWVVYPGQTAYPLDLRISALPLRDHRAVHPIPPR